MRTCCTFHLRDPSAFFLPLACSRRVEHRCTVGGNGAQKLLLVAKTYFSRRNYFHEVSYFVAGAGEQNLTCRRRFFALVARVRDTGEDGSTYTYSYLYTYTPISRDAVARGTYTCVRMRASFLQRDFSISATRRWMDQCDVLRASLVVLSNIETAPRDSLM